MFIKLLLIFSAALLFNSCGTTKNVAQQNSESATEQKQIVSEEPADDEFNRSTAGISITKEEFTSDKTEILNIIDELSIIMAKYDYDAWLKYIDPESVKYWSNPRNLLNASKRLPQKIRLSNLNDYFRFVFVPSRTGRSVEEIRYISRDSVKAVQVRDQLDIVYYNFVRVNGKWMVNLPELHD